MILFYGFHQPSLRRNNLGDVISIYDFINRRFHYITPDIRIIKTGEVSWNSRTSISMPSKGRKKKPHSEVDSIFFFQILLKLRFKGKFNPKMDIIEVFFSKLSLLFSDFEKGVGMVSPPSSPTSFVPV